jgi:hypothetical protein
MAHAPQSTSGAPSKGRPQRSPSGRTPVNLLSEEPAEIDARIERDGSIRVNARGPGALDAMADVLKSQIVSQTIRTCALYILATTFAVIALLFVTLSPNGRETACNIAAVALVIIAVVCAGFARFAINMPGLSAQGGVSPPSRRATSRKAGRLSPAVAPTLLEAENVYGLDEPEFSGDLITASSATAVRPNEIDELVSSIVVSPEISGLAEAQD